MSVSQRGSWRPCRRGFTLIEIVFVLAIFAVLAAIALPHWSTLLPGHHLRSAARQAQSELHRIKSQAIAENVTFRLAFSQALDNYTVERVVGSTITQQVVKPLPEGIDVRNSVTLGFTARGTASNSGTVKFCNNKGAGYNVVVSGTGRIRICSPSVCDGTC